MGGGAGVDGGAAVEEDPGDGFPALGDGFLEDGEADGGGDGVFGVEGEAVPREEGHHGVGSEGGAGGESAGGEVVDFQVHFFAEEEADGVFVVGGYGVPEHVFLVADCVYVGASC